MNNLFALLRTLAQRHGYTSMNAVVAGLASGELATVLLMPDHREFLIAHARQVSAYSNDAFDCLARNLEAARAVEATWDFDTLDED
jgi:hypothetical protein